MYRKVYRTHTYFWQTETAFSLGLFSHCLYEYKKKKQITKEKSDSYNQLHNKNWKGWIAAGSLKQGKPVTFIYTT